MQRHPQDKSSRLRSLSVGLALFAAQAAFSLAHAQTSYTLTPIGSLGGGSTSANAINNVGDVVGCSVALINGNPTPRAFVYRNGLMMDIGSLVTGGASCARDINDTGQITGNSDTATGEQRGFIYQNGVMTSLGNLGTSSVGDAINNAGLVAGTANNVGDSFVAAFRYDPSLNPPQVDIGNLGGAAITSRDMNAAGDIIGFAANAEFRGTSYVYRNGVVTDLGTVLGFPSTPNAINDLGQIVGTRTEGGYLLSNGVATTLPGLEGNDSSPSSINNAGQIVGSSWSANGNRAVSISQGVVVDLNTLIAASSPDKAFVTLEFAEDVNNNGMIIAEGVDSRTGARGAYLLRPVTR
jgi:probable HAF family extracellular repeat protein